MRHLSHREGVYWLGKPSPLVSRVLSQGRFDGLFGLFKHTVPMAFSSRVMSGIRGGTIGEMFDWRGGNGRGSHPSQLSIRPILKGESLKLLNPRQK